MPCAAHCTAPHEIDCQSSCRYFRCASECIEENEEFRKIFEASNLPSTQLFEKLLLAECTNFLEYGVIDTVQQMTAKTTEERREASDIWGRRKPWRIVSTPGPRGGTHGGQREVFWPRGKSTNPFPYYRHFTFILDAAPLSTVATSNVTREQAFMRNDVYFPPEVVAGPDNVGAGVWLMFYMLIHPEFGVVVPPSFMYWGSKTVRGTTRHSQAFINKYCWYVNPIDAEIRYTSYTSIKEIKASGFVNLTVLCISQLGNFRKLLFF